MGDKLRLFGVVLAYVPGFAGAALLRKLRAILHRWSYGGPTDAPKTVVVVGGSFAGVQLMARLADTLPTSWQAVLVEKNSHFNYSFHFPRYSVVPGYERSAFIPYDAILAHTLPGITRFVQGCVVSATGGDKKKLLLASGDTLPYDVLVVATGSAQRPPAKLRGAADREAACAELRALQERIRRARTVAVVGGGAVGIELAADVKTFAARVAEKGGKKGEDDDSVVDKEVTLVHSREQLLNRFGQRLHEHTLAVLQKLDINVVLGERPTVVYADGAPDDGQAEAGGAGTLRYADGREEAYDCVLLCTGLTPNSALLKDLCPGAISADSGEIRVAPTLQVVDAEGAPVPDLFAFGDVAATGGAKMARAGFFQADVVTDNVLAAIEGRPLTTLYKPSIIEPSIKLTLGKDAGVIYMDEDDGRSILLATRGESEDMDMKRAWSFFGAKYEEE